MHLSDFCFSFLQKLTIFCYLKTCKKIENIRIKTTRSPTRLYYDKFQNITIYFTALCLLVVLNVLMDMEMYNKSNRWSLSVHFCVVYLSQAIRSFKIPQTDNILRKDNGPHRCGMELKWNKKIWLRGEKMIKMCLVIIPMRDHGIGVEFSFFLTIFFLFL